MVSIFVLERGHGEEGAGCEGVVRLTGWGRQVTR